MPHDDDVRRAERQDLADDAGDRGLPLRRLRARDLLGRHESLDRGFRRELSVADRRVELLSAGEPPAGELPGDPALGFELLDRPLVFLQLPLEQPPPELHRLLLLLGVYEVTDLVPGAARGDKREPVAGGGLVGSRQDLDDVAAGQRRAQRHELPVDARSDAAVADVRVHAIREIHGGRAPREGEDLSLRRKGVDLVRIEVHFQGREELPGVGHLALPVHDLPQPLEPPVVGLRQEPPLLVPPVRGDPALGDQVHFLRADLDLERLRRVAHDRRVERLVEVRLGHRDVILDAAGDGVPALVHEAQGGIAVARLCRDDPEGQDVIELGHVHAAALDLRGDRRDVLAPARNLGLDPGLPQLRLELLADLRDHRLGALQALVDLARDLRVSGRLEIEERQVFELSLDEAHAEAVGERGVDVQGLPGDFPAAGLRQKLQGPHVVETVGQFDHDHADVGDHRQDHLPESLRLLLLARDVGEPADLRQAVHEIGNGRAELLRDRLAGRQRVLEDVVEKPDHDRDVVGLHLGEDRRDIQRMDQVGLPGAAHLAPVLAGREHVGPAQEVLVGSRVVRLDLFEDFLEADHEGNRLQV